MIDVQRLIGEVAARNGIRVEPGDPAFALVTLNQLVLEDAVKQIAEHIQAGIADFSDAVQKTENRAGRILAEEVKSATAELRRELQRDVDSARLGARELVADIHSIQTRAALIRWGTAGLVTAATLFGAGLWVGAQYLR
jgi:hypothetical protein